MKYMNEAFEFCQGISEYGQKKGDVCEK